MLFTIPSPMLRAANNTVSISIVELLALSKVSSNPQFADKVNWEKVTVCWKSTVGGQREYLSFAFAGASSSQSFYVSDNSRIDWVLSYVAITNIDKETLILSRADIPTVGMYDFSFGAVSGAASYQYIRLLFKEAWATSSSTGPSTTNLTLSEIKMKWDGNIQTLTSTPPTTSDNFAYGSVSDLVNDSVSDFSGYSSISSQPSLTFNLGQQRAVEQILAAPQSGLFNMPKKFDILGSNDGVSFTLLRAVDQANTSSWITNQYTEFNIDAGEPSGAQYRYIKMEVYQSWADNTQTGTSGIVSIAEFKLKIDDVIETLTSYPRSSFNAVPSSVLGGDSFSYFVDGLDTPDSNLTFWTLNGVDFALFQIDIGAGKTVSEVLIAPQLAGSTSANMPKSFKIFGSNDNVAFTEILNVNETTLSEAGSWIAARYKVFPIV